jgi:hypothetical protein
MPSARASDVPAQGQAIVEAALVLPIMLAVLLGVAGIFYLDLSHRAMQNGIDVLTQLAASDPTGSWHSVVPDEDRRTRCNASPQQPDVTYPDGDATPGKRIRLTWFCHLETHGWLYDGTPITVQSEAVIVPTASGTP